MDYPQMVLALLKYKDIVGTISRTKAKEIDRYVSIITMICTKYSELAYWSYHLYFWDKASECEERGIFLDWSVLDSEALHAAIAQNSATNFCNSC